MNIRLYGEMRTKVILFTKYGSFFKLVVVIFLIISVSVDLCCFSLVCGASGPNKESSSKSLIAFPWEPITKVKILPNTFPIPATQGNKLFLQGCRGEYEPASFILRALKNCKNIRIVATDLKDHKGGIISSESIDIRLVKCWYQAGSKTHRQTGKRVLVPELLLHDDSLVRVDYRKKRNYLKVLLNGKSYFIDISSPTATLPAGAKIIDSPSLRPFNLEKGTNKQVWITVKIPENQSSGEYSGKILVYSNNSSSAVLSLLMQVTVFPFDLEKPLLEYSIYYRGKITSKPVTKIGSEWKTPEQYRIELLDMREHGIEYPTLYQRMDNQIDTALLIRSKLGLPKNKLYVLGQTSGNPVERKKLEALKKKVNKWLKKAAQFGYRSLYIYGKDEARGKKLASERRAWEWIHDCGAHVFVACSEGAVNIIGDLLDVAVLHGAFKSEEVKKWHEYGKEVLIYSNPQGGIENPEIYRRNYGLLLLLNGYDGAMPYAYQHSMGNIWNDFDHKVYRDLVFSYPISNGVVNTVEWEGFREAVDDVRYLSTLVSLCKNKKSVLNDLSYWLLKYSSLSDLRHRIIIEIMRQLNYK